MSQFKEIINKVLTEHLTPQERTKTLEDAYAWATTLSDADLEEFICILDCRSEMYYCPICPMYAGARLLRCRLEDFLNNK